MAYPGHFMNCRRETREIGVPPGNRAQRRRLRRVQGVGSETYLNGTSQGPTPEDARLPARRAYSSERRTAISVVTAGNSWNIRDMCLKYFWGNPWLSIELIY